MKLYFYLLKRKFLISMVDNLALQLNSEDWDNYALAKLVRLRQDNRNLALYFAAVMLSAITHWSWVCLHYPSHQSMWWLIQKLALYDQPFALLCMVFVFWIWAFLVLRLLWRHKCFLFTVYARIIILRNPERKQAFYPSYVVE